MKRLSLSVGRRQHLFVVACVLSIGCGRGPATTTTPGDATTIGDATGTGSETTDSETTDSTSTPTCTPGTITTLGTNFMIDISDKSGIRIENVLRNTATPVPINDHSRLGFVDLNGDHLPDIVTHSLYPNPKKGIPFEHLIYLNNGDGTFKHFSDESGLRDVQAGIFAFADVDNDGDQDCFAMLDIPLKGRTHLLLLNDGKAHFSVKKLSGVEGLPPIAGNAVFADFDGDAKLDLFVGLGHTSYKGVNVLLKGNGDGTFSPGLKLIGNGVARPTNGSVMCDFNNDGKPDLAVSNYGVSVASGHNELYVNQGDGSLINRAVTTGFAYQMGGNPWLTMLKKIGDAEPKPAATGPIGSNGFGLDCGDIDRDGRMDIFITAISHPNIGTYTRKWSDGTQLLLNRSDGDSFVWVNETQFRSIPFNEGDVDGAMIDFDNDGRLDLSISRDKKYEGNYSTLAQKAWFGLLHQQKNGKFKSVGPESGINRLTTKNSASLSLCSSDSTCSGVEKCLAKRCRTPCSADTDCAAVHEICHTGGFCKSLLAMKSAQNHAWADIDGDGDLDLLVGGRDTGGGRPNFLFRNDVGSKSPYVKLWLEGDGINVNRDALGARVTIRFKSGVVLLREVKASRGMGCSMDGRAMLIGLGDLGCDYTVEIRWPDGKKVEFTASELPPRQAKTVRYPKMLVP